MTVFWIIVIALVVLCGLAVALWYAVDWLLNVTNWRS